MIRGAEGKFVIDDIVFIAEWQDYQCFYCPTPLEPDAYTVDHILPPGKLFGGSNWPYNLCLACRSCNASKGKRDPNEFHRSRDMPPAILKLV